MAAFRKSRSANGYCPQDDRLTPPGPRGPFLAASLGMN